MNVMTGKANEEDGEEWGTVRPAQSEQKGPRETM